MTTISVTRVVDGELGPVEATVDGEAWTCSNNKFLSVLQCIHLEPGYYYPDRDLALANRVLDLYHGSMIKTSVRPAPPEGAVE